MSNWIRYKNVLINLDRVHMVGLGQSAATVYFWTDASNDEAMTNFNFGTQKEARDFFRWVQDQIFKGQASIHIYEESAR